MLFLNVGSTTASPPRSRHGLHRDKSFGFPAPSAEEVISTTTATKPNSSTSTLPQSHLDTITMRMRSVLPGKDVVVNAKGQNFATGVPNGPAEGTPLLDAASSKTTSEIDSKDVFICGRRRLNHNVFLNLAVSVLQGVATSLWKDTAYVAYLKEICGGRNEPIGIIQGVSGLAGLAAALPMGWCADHYGRDRVVRAGGIMLSVATVAQVGVIHSMAVGDALWPLAVLMAAFGLRDCVVRGPAMVLIADSTAPGDRTRIYNYRFASFHTSRVAGQLASIALFRGLGDGWDLRSLRVMMYAGFAFQLAAAVLMCFFDDEKTLDEKDHGGEKGVDKKKLPSIDVKRGNSEENRLTPMQSRQRWIPYIAFTFDLFLALASGLSVKYFPLYFKDTVGMSPLQVQTIYLFMPTIMVFGSTLGTKLSGSGFGRVQTTLLFKVLGIAELYIIVFFKFYLNFHPILLASIFVLREGIMFATRPLQQSLLMDFVPKDVRARWQSLDSVSWFGWCGSSAVGGWLADKFNYTFTFLITAIVQSLGVGVCRLV